MIFQNKKMFKKTPKNNGKEQTFIQGTNEEEISTNVQVCSNAKLLK